METGSCLCNCFSFVNLGNCIAILSSNLYIIIWFGAQEVTSLEDQEEVDFSGRVVRFAPRAPSPPTPPVSNLYQERFQNLPKI